MARIKRIYIPIACSSGKFAQRGLQLHGNLVGVAYRPFPADRAQVATITMDGTGGTFDIIRNGATVAGISPNETAANVETVLNGDDNFGVVTVVRSGSVNHYMYTLTFGGATTYGDDGSVKRGGLGAYFAVSTSATNLTGGAGTAVVADTGATPMTSTADVILRDRLSGVAVLSDSSFGSGSYSAPTMVGTTIAGVALSEAAGHSIDRPIPLSGLYDLYIANATTNDKGSLWLLVQE